MRASVYQSFQYPLKMSKVYLVEVYFKVRPHEDDQLVLLRWSAKDENLLMSTRFQLFPFSQCIQHTVYCKLCRLISNLCKYCIFEEDDVLLDSAATMVCQHRQYFVTNFLSYKNIFGLKKTIWTSSRNVICRRSSCVTKFLFSYFFSQIHLKIFNFFFGFHFFQFENDSPVQ